MEDSVQEAVEDSVQKENKGGLSSKLSKANPLAATGQTVDVVRWMSNRRQFLLRGVPYGFTGLPVLYFSPNTGWNYGARLHWVDYRRRPYRYKMTLYVLKSSEGSRNFAYRLKVPRISGTGFGLRLLLKAKTDLRTRYYGRGNNIEFNKDLIDPESPSFKDENYYFYVLKAPRLIFSLLREIRGPVSMSTGVGLERTDVSQRGEESFYADEGTPDGVKDGLTGFFSLTLQWDTRDDDTIPGAGVFHEWSYETSRNSLLCLFLEEIDFRRYTFTDARYYPLSDRLVLAHRMVFEALKGSVPLYAYGEIGGSKRIKGLGGSDTLRGYDKQRFTDNARFFSNTELRYHLRSVVLFKQWLEWHGVVFLDTGRVWADVEEVGLTGLHGTGGVGLRLYWNSDFVIRTDIGFSDERRYVALKYRNLF